MQHEHPAAQAAIEICERIKAQHCGETPIVFDPRTRFTPGEEFAVFVRLIGVKAGGRYEVVHRLFQPFGRLALRT